MTVTQITPTVISSQALPGGPPGATGPAGTSTSYKINGQTGTMAYTIGPGDAGSLIIFSGTLSGVSVTLNPSNIVAGFWVAIKNNNVSGQITYTIPVGTLLDGLTTGTLDPKCTHVIIFGGLNFESLGPSDGGTF